MSSLHRSLVQGSSVYLSIGSLGQAMAASLGESSRSLGLSKAADGKCTAV